MQSCYETAKLTAIAYPVPAGTSNKRWPYSTWKDTWERSLDTRVICTSLEIYLLRPLSQYCVARTTVGFDGIRYLTISSSISVGSSLMGSSPNAQLEIEVTGEANTNLVSSLWSSCAFSGRLCSFYNTSLVKNLWIYALVDRVSMMFGGQFCIDWTVRVLCRSSQLNTIMSGLWRKLSIGTRLCWGYCAFSFGSLCPLKSAQETLVLVRIAVIYFLDVGVWLTRACVRNSIISFGQFIDQKTAKPRWVSKVWLISLSVVLIRAGLVADSASQSTCSILSQVKKYTLTW